MQQSWLAHVKVMIMSTADRRCLCLKPYRSVELEEHLNALQNSNLHLKNVSLLVPQTGYRRRSLDDN